jgi:hypothetical protein
MLALLEIWFPENFAVLPDQVFVFSIRHFLLIAVCPCIVGRSPKTKEARQIVTSITQIIAPSFLDRAGVTWVFEPKTLNRENAMPPKLTPEIINAAIEGLEGRKTRIDVQIAELRALQSGGPVETAATTEAPTRKRKKFSAAARRRMKEAQQRRWAKIKGESEPLVPIAAPIAPAKAKRKLSAAGRAAIVAATKKRWAAIHKAEKPATKTAPAKKKMSPARKAALLANLAKARSARAAKRAAA